MEFELLDHPADIGFRAYGASVEELFANCARALVFIILDPSNIRSAQKVLLSAAGSDLESLLVNWLNEVLYYVDSKRLAFCSLAVSFPFPFELTCVASGEVRDRLKHPVRLSVKAVTYHQLKISNLTFSRRGPVLLM